MAKILVNGSQPDLGSLLMRGAGAPVGVLALLAMIVLPFRHWYSTFCSHSI